MCRHQTARTISDGLRHSRRAQALMGPRSRNKIVRCLQYTRTSRHGHGLQLTALGPGFDFLTGLAAWQASADLRVGCDAFSLVDRPRGCSPLPRPVRSSGQEALCGMRPAQRRLPRSRTRISRCRCNRHLMTIGCRSGAVLPYRRGVRRIDTAEETEALRVSHSMARLRDRNPTRREQSRKFGFIGQRSSWVGLRRGSMAAQAITARQQNCQTVACCRDKCQGWRRRRTPAPRCSHRSPGSHNDHFAIPHAARAGASALLQGA
jgi:hypothetical protein